MRCDHHREAISAALDGEEPPSRVDADALAAHLAGCAGCRQFRAASASLHRAVRVRAADAVPDLTAPILANAPRPHVTREWARYALLAVGLTQLVLALPALIYGNDPGASTHVARELGSFDIALAVGLLFAVWQPRRAAGLLPFAAALAGTLMVTAALDVASGRAGAIGESQHVLDVVGVGLLWALSRPVGMRVTLRAA
jgi:predicted anti-sigma-YlaC factor YlaD